jgi:transposase
MRGLLRNFGLKVGVVSRGTFETKIRELIEADPDLADIMEPLLAGRRKLREEFAKLDKKVVHEAKGDDVCKRLMTVPGVGPVVSLAYVSTIDIPSRFRHSRAVGAVLGSRRCSTSPAKANGSAMSRYAGMPCCERSCMRQRSRC